jgi:hypothetical protein
MTRNFFNNMHADSIEDEAIKFSFDDSLYEQSSDMVRKIDSPLAAYLRTHSVLKITGNQMGCKSRLSLEGNASRQY